MQVLFVHGMWRSPLSGWPMFRQLRRAGLSVETLGYSVAFESFASIKQRVIGRVVALARAGDYVLIGHSLGGVLIRAALSELPPGTRAPAHVFLLGSPVRPSRLALKLAGNRLFRALTGDCGDLLASARRMSEVGAVAASTTGIAGTLGFSGQRGPFNGETNDGVVSLSEVSADWLTDQVQIRVVHSLLPSSRRVAEIVLQRLRREDQTSG